MALGYRSLIFDISANVAKLTTDLTKATNSFKKLETDVSKIMGSISGIANKTIGGIAFGAAIMGFERLLKSTADMGEELLKLSKQTQLTVEDVQKLKYAAEMSETDFQDLIPAIGIFSQKLADMGNASAESTKRLKELGITTADYSKPTIELFYQVTDALSKMADGHKKVAIARDIMGRGAQGMLPLLSEGSNKIREYGEKLEKMGAIMSTDMVMAADRFNDTLRTIQIQLNSLKLKALAPIMEEISKWLGDINVYATEHKKIVEGGIYKSWLAVKGVIESIGNVLEPFLPLLKIVGEIGVTAAKGWGIIASVILPVISKRIGYIIKGMLEWIALVGNLTNAFWKFTQLDFAGAAEEAKQAKENFRLAGKYTGMAFSSGFMDEMGIRFSQWEEDFNKKMGITKPKKRQKGDEIDIMNDKIKSLFDTWDKKRLELEFQIKMQGFDELTVNLEKVKLEYAKTLMDFKKAEKEGLRMPGFENLLKQAESAEKFNLVSKAVQIMSEQISGLNPNLESSAGKFSKVSDQLGELRNSIYNAGKDFEPFLNQLDNLKVKLDAFELETVKQEFENLFGDFKMSSGLEKEIQSIEKQQTNLLKFIADNEGKITEIYGDAQSVREKVVNEGLKKTEKAYQDYYDRMQEMTMEKQLRELEIELKTKIVMPIVETDIIKKQMDIINKSIEYYQGQLDEINYDGLMSEEIQERILELSEHIDGLTERIIELKNREQELTGTFGEGLSDGIKEAINDMGTLYQQGEELGKAWASNLEQAFSDLFDDLITGELKSFSDYWTKFWQSLAKSMADIISKQLAQALLEGLSGGGLSGILKDIGGIIGIGGNDYETFEGNPFEQLLHKGGIAGLPKYHTGQLPQNEVLARLLKTERVLSPDQTKVFDRIMRIIDSISNQGGTVQKGIINNIYNKTINNIDKKGLTGGLTFAGTQKNIERITKSDKIFKEIIGKSEKIEKIARPEQNIILNNLIKQMPSMNTRNENIKNLITNNNKIQTDTVEKQGQNIMIHIPVNVEGRKRMAGELTKEIEKTVIDVMRRYN